MKLRCKKRTKKTIYEGYITRRELLELAEVEGTQFESVSVAFPASPVQLGTGLNDSIAFSLEVTEDLGG